MPTGGRPKSSEWQHFLEIAPKYGDRPAIVVCMNCVKFHNEMNGPAPEEIQGRLDRLRSHLRKCTALSKQAAVHASSQASNEFVTPRKRRAEPSFTTPSPSKRASESARSFTKLHVSEINKQVARAQASLGLPDTFISDPELLHLFELIRPGISRQLIRPRQLGNLVREHAKEVFDNSVKELKEHQAWTQGRVNLLSDGWENRSRVHLLGYQLSLHGHVVTLALGPVGTTHNGVAIAKELETTNRPNKVIHVMSEAFDERNPGPSKREDPSCPTALACAIGNDSTNIPAILHSFDYLKTSFKDIATEAATLVRILNASSAKWLPRAKDEMDRMCGSKLAFYTVCDTRWNSMQACFASLLRVKTALENFTERYMKDNDFPPSILVFKDEIFWSRLAAAEAAIRPLAEASYSLQRDSNTLSDVVEMFMKMYDGFRRNARFGTKLVGCIEQRWQKCEQPLLLVAFFLHPKRAGCESQFNDSLKTKVSAFVFYYFRKFISDEPDLIRSVFGMHIGGRLTRSRASQFKDVFEYWREVSSEKSGNCRLAKLALVVLSIGANPAPCERMFSDLGQIHSAVRNRMAFDKALAFHRIRQHITATSKKNSSKPKRTSSRIIDPTDRRTINEQARIQQSSPLELEEYEESIHVEDTFSFWEGLLAEIMDDDELDYEFCAQHPPEEVDAYEQINHVDPNECPLPDDETVAVEQDRGGGLRAWKISLHTLCAEKDACFIV